MGSIFGPILTKLFTLTLVLFHQASVALFCYAGIIHADLKNESQNATVRKLKSEMLDWESFIDGTIYKMGITNLLAVFTCLVVLVELFNTSFVATSVFITLSFCASICFPSSEVTLDPIFQEFPWDRSVVLLGVALYTISIFYQQNPVEQPKVQQQVNNKEESLERKVIQKDSVKPRLKYNALKTAMVLGVHVCIFSKNYGIFQHFYNFRWPKAIDNLSSDFILPIRLMLLHEVAQSTVGLFVVFLQNSFLVIVFAAMILLDAVFYKSILISPHHWNWDGLGFGTLSLAGSLLFTLVLIFMDNGVLYGDDDAPKKTVNKQENELKVEKVKRKEEKRKVSGLGKIFVFANILVHLYTHYHYCKLNLSYLEMVNALEPKSSPEIIVDDEEISESTANKAWIYFPPIYLTVTVALIELLFANTFNRTMFFLFAMLALVLVQAPQFPLSLDPIVLAFDWSQLGFFVTLVCVHLCAFRILYRKFYKFIANRILRYDPNLDDSTIKRMSMACICLCMNQANAHLVIHLQDALVIKAINNKEISANILQIAFSTYLGMAANWVGLYSDLINKSAHWKWLYGALIVFYINFYPATVVAPQIWQWNGIGFSVAMIAATIGFSAFYFWLCVAGAYYKSGPVPTAKVPAATTKVIVPEPTISRQFLRRRKR